LLPYGSKRPEVERLCPWRDVLFAKVWFVIRDACQLSQEPLGDAEQVQDGAQLERGEELRACACEHSVSRESCCGPPYRSLRSSAV